MKEDVKHIKWTGRLTNERVPQNLIDGRKGVFVDCSKPGNGRRSGQGIMRRGSLMRDVELMARGRKVGYDEY